MLSREIEHAFFLSKFERDAVIEEMEEFAKKEIEKLKNGF